MKRDMSRILARIFTVALLTMVSMGAWADVDVQIANNGNFDGGTIVVKSQENRDGGVEVTITVTPNNCYTITKDAISVYSTTPPSGPNSGTRNPEIAETLTLYYNGSNDADTDDLFAERDYTFIVPSVPSGLGAWVKEATFQLDYSGTYYIGSRGYNASNTTTNYYLCPTEGWAFYVATNNVQGTDNGQPFLTTYRCRNGVYDVRKAVWTIEKAPAPNDAYYYIKQALTGKYVVSNGVLTGAGNTRARVHLETVANAEALATLGDWALFEINYDNGHYDILPHSTYGRDGDNIYLVVNTNNYNQLDGNNKKTNGPTGFKDCAGIIGLYTHPDDGNAYFYLETAIPVTPAPTITNNYDGTITITGTGFIYYTTDGTDPTTSSSTYSSAITLTDDITVIKAMAKDGTSYESMVVTYELPKCEKPVITISSGNVSISSATDGATVYYTTDNTQPTSNSTAYSAPFSLGDIAMIRAIALKPGWVKSDEAYYMDYRTVSSSTEMTNMNGLYRLANDFTSTASIGTESEPFSGVIDGQMNTIFGLNHPLVAYANGATIKNVILDNVGISSGTNVGAICGEATGATRIYNCGVLASNSTVTTDKNGYTEITSCSSTIKGSGYVGGIVGLLDGSSRVINCFSYANITGGNEVGGIVGHNNVATTATNLKTMVMNCMFYGDIDYNYTTSRAPIYNGSIITNVGDGVGVGNYNYFWAGASYVQNQKITAGAYNCALAAETRYLQRFEFFRHMLNSNRELAAWWATDSRDKKDEMMKWVMEPSQIGTAIPYPILKAPKDDEDNVKKYPSVVNIDAANAETFDDTTKKLPYNKGRKFGTLTINIQNASSGAPTGASITTSKVYPNITDKDPDHFNFNYYKVQLPYYNDVGTKNYTDYKVVTGWKIVSISDGSHDFTTGSDATADVNDDDITLTTPYNFADRKSTQKDDYSTNGNRIFNQGAYFDVPEGVTSITIEPYWAKCRYVADEYFDVVYDQNMENAYSVTTIGGGKRYEDNTFNGQQVYKSIADALSGWKAEGSVNNNAIVLVGNVHSNSISYESKDKLFTLMSVDMDHDNEPDYSYILRFDGRKSVHPVRIDFLNVIGLGMAQKSTGGTGTYNFGIMQPRGWFECTNTGLFRVTQLEYDHKGRNSAPIILHGGVIEQWVTYGQGGEEAKSVQYYHVGGNVWFKEFHIGVHQDRTDLTSPHPPISVSGGDYDEFYLTGYYNSPATNFDDNAECYINGGRFGKVAGTGMQGIGVAGRTPSTDDTGNIIWQIDNADIDEFYAGGINAAHIAEGNIYTVITNSRVDQFCGGPKFGDMNSDKKVVTNATNCTFRTFFGAGYGGNSYNRRYPTNKNNIVDNFDWDTWVQGNDGLKYRYNSEYSGVETRINYQFIPMSNNTQSVARLFVDHVSFSKATTYDVTSKLTGCTITKNELGRLDISDNDKRLGNFYGGGSLGKVSGPVKSTLTNCTIDGNVYGAGYSATLPKVSVMKDKFPEGKQPKYDKDLGAYLEAELPETAFEYTWEHATTVNSTDNAIDKTNHILYTTEDLTELGQVTGTATLNIDGSTTVAGSVYGGGEESDVTGNTQVNILAKETESGEDKVWTSVPGTVKIEHNVFGGGKGVDDTYECEKAMVGIKDQDTGNTSVVIGNGTVQGNVYGGGEVGRVEKDTRVTIGLGTSEPIIEGSVYGAGEGKETHGYSALVRGDAYVTIQAKAKVYGSVYGGGEIATVGKYWVKGVNYPSPLTPPTPPSDDVLPDLMPYAPRSGGVCTVIVKDNAEIGNGSAGGHVFGAGKGVSPHYFYEEGNMNANSKRMVLYEEYNSTTKKGHNPADLHKKWDYYPDDHSFVWEYFPDDPEEMPEGETRKTGEEKYTTFLETLALASETDVTINNNGGKVLGSVYGGSENGFVQTNTEVKIQGGEIGTTTSGGYVFGGGKGIETHAAAGRVKGNTRLTISGGTIARNVYGGGELGHVGTFTETADGRFVMQQVKDKNGDDMDTGLCTVIINGGKVGPDNNNDTEKGNVFGAGKGKDDTFKCEKAMAINTSVSVSAGTVNGNVYGGGEIGRVEYDTEVQIGSGEGTGGTSSPIINGSVFGAGRGVATHGYSALVRKDTKVTIEGDAKVGRSVYGGGEIASVGRYGLDAQKMPSILLGLTGFCTVKVKGHATIGPEDAPDDKGNVFGAGKGINPNTFDKDNSDHSERSRRMTVYTNATEFRSDGTTNRNTTWEYYEAGSPFVWEYYQTPADYSTYLETLALATHPEVTISGSATVNGSVFGGGELGLTKGSVIVTINGGTIEKDVYGGGALANTNTTSSIGKLNPDGSPVKDENDQIVLDDDVHPTTTVNLYGGLINGDAYGGGLGKLGEASGGVHYTQDEIDAAQEGDPAYGKTTGDWKVEPVAASEGDGAIKAMVYGDVFVTLGDEGATGATAFNISTLTDNSNPTKPVQVVNSGRVFGCNNLNGSPTGNVTVTVNKTVSLDAQGTVKDKPTLNTHTYELAAVYGGGNLANYVAKSEDKKPKVIISKCDVSIEEVYGGGNAAEVPETDVLVLGAYEIENLFGGGNGEDNYTLDGGTTWNTNPGANVKGNATTVLKGGYIHAGYGGSNSKGTITGDVSITKDSGGACPLNVIEIYGAGKDADVEGDLILVMGCSTTRTEAVYGCSMNANVKGNVELTITSGEYGKVFGGNNKSGAIFGHIIVNIEETGCSPIIIDELYGCGNDAAYSIFGYYQNGTIDGTATGKPKYVARTSATDHEDDVVTFENKPHTIPPYDDPVVNVISATRIGRVFGGGLGANATVYGNPKVNINMIKGAWANKNYNGVTIPDKLGEIGCGYSYVDETTSETVQVEGGVFGGGNAANVEGNTTVNIGTVETVDVIVLNADNKPVYESDGVRMKTTSETVLGANIKSNVYGGGNLADVTGNTFVNICAKKSESSENYEAVAEGTLGVTIGGTVYGGGKGLEDTFTCEKAMIGVENEGFGSTNVLIGNGTVGGNVYGGGEIGRVESNTVVTIGLDKNDVPEGKTSAPIIAGNVFGAGKGLSTHGYSALVRGNSTVTIQSDAKVKQSVYGGGEIASVGKYSLNEAGIPVSLANQNSGYCTVIVRDNAEIGPDDPMTMITTSGYPDDAGHVFGAGRGVLPYEEVTGGMNGEPWRMKPGNIKQTFVAGKYEYEEGKENPNPKIAYLRYIETLALATQTYVTISDNALVKGSVYGGSMNGHVQHDTQVTIAGGQIGCTKNTTGRIPDNVWEDNYEPNGTDWECASWSYGVGDNHEPPYAPYDIYDLDTNDKPKPATDGHTFYGNVFGGGSGYYPYAQDPDYDTKDPVSHKSKKDLGYSDGLWHRDAGSVGGNTMVNITGGHILTSVYGGNEQTDVGTYLKDDYGDNTITVDPNAGNVGQCIINMTGGTVGVPRTVAQMKAHPVTCYVFGAGKGDQRINFNTWTNVASTQVNISGKARIYGSTFGGGEDGHVIGDAVTTISKGDNVTVSGKEVEYPYIGTTGTSAVDGNIFGGGRGFSETALTAGVVGGNTTVNIHGGTMLGTVFGGGRLASVGTNFANAEDTNYGKMQGEASDMNHGVIRINIDGGTIGATGGSQGELAASDFSIGDVFGGCKGSSNNDLRFGLAKHTFVTMTGGKVKGSVYGGGEVAVVEGDATIEISGGEIGDGVTKKGGAKIGNIFGGGKGNTTTADAGLIMGNTKVTINPGSSDEPIIYHNIYGGGAYGSVGTITRAEDGASYVPGKTANVLNMPTAWIRKTGETGSDTGKAEVYVYGGIIGIDGDENGMVFGSSRGDVATPGTDEVDPNDRLAWVYNTKVVIGNSDHAPTIKGSVYGSGENGHVFNDSQVEVHKGTIGVTDDDAFEGPNYRLRGNVYGGGCGEDNYPGTTDFNPLAGIVLGTANVTIDGGQVVHNVYGAGALGSVVGKTTVTIADNAIIGVEDGTGGNVFGAARGKEGITVPGSNLANSPMTEVNINSGQVWNSVYGGGEAGYVKQGVVVNMTGGVVAKDIYGGGALADTNTDNWDAAKNDGAGGWAEGKTSASNTTTINLLGGTIGRNAYGGGLGQVVGDVNGGTSNIVAIVYGDVNLNLNGLEASDYVAATHGSLVTGLDANNASTSYRANAGCIVKGEVYGCNNINGTPKGHAKVHVFKTVSAGHEHGYDVTNVFGGGNKADYVPADTKQATEVIIEGCGLTSIQQVYGGGNAAATPGTLVLVKGTKIIDEVFGGGNGVGSEDPTAADYNPGANVGYKTKLPTETDLTPYASGGGKSLVQLMAGTVHNAYGGSNSNGDIRGGSSVTTVENEWKDGDGANASCCEKLIVDHMFGGGKNANMKSGANIVLGCSNSNTWVKEIYAGAENANVGGDVSLTLTSGKYGRVFGGNKTDGILDGSITVNIEENGQCGIPLIIGELYGGGNMAAYSIYGYNNDGTLKTSGDNPHASPVVNVRAFTSIGNIFGGGYGIKAEMYGSPTININETLNHQENAAATSYSGNAYNGETLNFVDDVLVTGDLPEGATPYTVVLPKHEDGKIGAINNVFGGGNAAKVNGDTNVNIGTTTSEPKVKLDNSGNPLYTDEANTIPDKEDFPVVGADIRGNVYGGGNKAEVTGNTNVVIGKQSATPVTP